MKRMTTLIFALLLGASLSFAQTGGDKKAADTSKKPATESTQTAPKGEKTKKGHKGGKKSKKGSKGDTGSTTPK